MSVKHQMSGRKLMSGQKHICLEGKKMEMHRNIQNVCQTSNVWKNLNVKENLNVWKIFNVWKN